jgi:hypothetical protein
LRQLLLLLLLPYEVGICKKLCLPCLGEVSEELQLCWDDSCL